MRCKTVCAWGFYHAGDLVSEAMYRLEWEWGWSLYQWLMRRSMELDLTVMYGPDDEEEKT